MELHTDINLYDDIFSIQCISENTIRNRWYLVQAMIIVDSSTNNDFLTIGLYIVSNLARYPDDSIYHTILHVGGQNDIIVPYKTVTFLNLGK